MGAERWGGRGEPGMPLPSCSLPLPLPLPHILSCPIHLASPGFGSLPCILNACSGDVKSTSCINLSLTDTVSCAQRPRPRVLLKAPTLAEMEEMNTSEVRPYRILRRDQGGAGQEAPGSEKGLSKSRHSTRPCGRPSLRASGRALC